jgi:hypothetical protein
LRHTNRRRGLNHRAAVNLRRKEFILHFHPPLDFFSRAANDLRGCTRDTCLSVLMATLMCDDEKTQGCRDSLGENIGSNHHVTLHQQ